MSQSPKHRRNSLRLQGYDYSALGGYFVTICSYQKTHIFGDCVDDEIILSEMGDVARDCWLAIPQHFEDVTLDIFMIMPNHIHGIILIHDQPNNNSRSGAKHVSPLPKDYTESLPPRNKTGSPPKSISAIISSFKASVTREIRKEIPNMDNIKIWQRGFYDHVIRNDDGLRRIQQYIHDNPLKWEHDDYYE